MVVYSPCLLTSLAKISKTFGVSAATVKQWVKEGAPIAVEGADKGMRYSAELVALQQWRLEKSKAFENPVNPLDS